MAEFNDNFGQDILNEVMEGLHSPPNSQESPRLLKAARLSFLADLVEMVPAQINNADLLQKALAFVREELIALDAMLPILTNPEKLQAGKEWVALAYKLVQPSVKILNDEMLGPQRVDAFFESVRNLFSDLGRSIGIMPTWQIHNYFNGATLLVDLQAIPEVPQFTDTGLSREDFVKQRLLGIIEEQIQALLEAHILRHLDDPSLAQDQVELLKRWLRAAEVRFSFGLAYLPAIPDASAISSDLALQIRQAFNQAQQAGNLKALRLLEMPESERQKREAASFFKLEDLLADSLRTRWDVEALATTPGFEHCFHYEGEELRMNPEAIIALRKNKRPDGVSDGMWAAFVAYYKAINSVDLLKPFQVKHFPAYYQRLLKLKTLIEKIDGSLQNNAAEVSSMHGLLNEAFEELTICPKDEGDQIAQSEYGLIAAMRRPGAHQMFFVDHVGFGPVNVASHEALISKLLGSLDLSTLKAMDSSARYKALSGWVQANPDMAEAMRRLLFEAGDPGTSLLHSKNRIIVRDVLDSTAVNNASGGDESVIDTLIPEGQEINWAIEGVRVRVAQLYTDKPILSPLACKEFPTEANLATLAPEKLKELRVYVLLASWAERIHAAIKAQNDPSRQLMSARL